MGGLGTLELKLELVRNKCDELTIGGLPLGIAHRIAKEALQGVQITPVPGDFDSVANGPFYPGRRGLEGFGHLGVENLGDGVACLTARLGGF